MFGMMVLNGRTEGDSEEELTYISEAGKSVIDLLCLSIDAVEIVRNFQWFQNGFQITCLCV